MKKMLKFMSVFGSGITLGIGMAKLMKRSDKTESERTLKFKTQFYMVNHWVSILQANHNLLKYFEENGYDKIAIYGLGTLGGNLANELKDKVVFAIDESAEGRDGSRFPVYYMEDDINEKADVIVVTPVSAFWEIKAKCEQKFDCPVISLEDVIYDIN